MWIIFGMQNGKEVKYIPKEKETIESAIKKCYTVCDYRFYYNKKGKLIDITVFGYDCHENVSKICKMKFKKSIIKQIYLYFKKLINNEDL